MAVRALACKECGTEYELEARYVCERCFGPLEVLYDLASLDAESAKRRIQAGPQNLWRYSDFLPFAQPPLYALPAGGTPLIRAPRLAERLGLRDVWVKNDAANPTHSFKDRVVNVAIAKALELGFETVACASTGNLANAVAAHAAAAGLES
ncbi:MAG: threonine synthase, partial [Thermoleophilaceae bacterium]